MKRLLKFINDSWIATLAIAIVAGTIIGHVIGYLLGRWIFW